MRVLQGLFLFLTFFLDVHVKAAELGACFGKKAPCAVQNRDGNLRLKQDHLQISLAPLSLLEQRDQKTVELIHGVFYIEADKPLTFQTPYAKVWCESSCEGLFERQETALTIKSLGGSWRLKRTGEAQVYQVPAGLQVLVSEVNEEGHALMDFPQSLPWLSTVREWSELYPGGLIGLKPRLEEFRPVWRAAVEAVSQLQQVTVQRTVASYESEQAKEKTRLEAIERENRDLRRMFHDNNP